MKTTLMSLALLFLFMMIGGVSISTGSETDESKSGNANQEARTMKTEECVHEGVTLKAAVPAEGVAGNAVPLTVSVINKGAKSIEYTYGRLPQAFLFTVMDVRNQKPAPMTEFGKRHFLNNGVIDKLSSKKLGPSDSLNIKFNLAQYFDLSIAGEYKLLLDWPADPGNPVHNTNLCVRKLSFRLNESGSFVMADAKADDPLMMKTNDEQVDSLIRTLQDANLVMTNDELDSLIRSLEDEKLAMMMRTHDEQVDSLIRSLQDAKLAKEHSKQIAEVISTLGSLRSTKAIPALISLITFEPTIYSDRLLPFTKKHPAIGALVQIGKPSVGPLINAVAASQLDFYQTKMAAHVIKQIEGELASQAVGIHLKSLPADQRDKVLASKHFFFAFEKPAIE